MVSSPNSWPQMHLLQVEVGVIPCSLNDFVPSEQWLVLALLKDFHLT